MATLEDLLTTRIPPHNLEAERALLGAWLLEPEAGPRLLAQLRAEDFYREHHRWIFAACGALLQAGAPPDVVLLADALSRTGQLAEIGGAAYLAQLVEDAAVLSRLDAYAEIVRNKAGLRELIRLATEVIGRSYEANGAGPAPILAEMRTRLEALTETVSGDTEAPVTPAAAPRSMAEVLDEVVAGLRAGQPPFLRTPIEQLNDRLCGGLLPGELVYLGGAPGSAKTAMALELAVFAAQHEHPVMVVSAEMTNAALGRRVLAQQAQIASSALRRADLDVDEWRRLERALPRLAALPITWDDSTTQIGEIRRRVLRQTPAPHLVIVDYLQLLSAPAQKDRRLEIDVISRTLKRLAKRLPCVVFALSNITPPAPDGRKKPGRPTMRSLKESRGLEHDADVVLLLHRPDPDSTDRELIIDKARDGETGTIDLDFRGIYLRFTELSKEDKVPF